MGHGTKLDRRRFLQIGAAVSALPLAAGTVFQGAASGNPSRSIPLFRVIFDERFAQSVAFGVQARRLRAVTRAIRGDITDVWYEELDLRWRGGPAAIAGMTTGDSLFCLERLAWDRGMRTVFRTEHRYPTAGWNEHVISGPQDMLRHASGLADAGTDWGGRMAHWVMHCTDGCTQKTEAKVMTAARGERAPLVSWVIA